MRECETKKRNVLLGGRVSNRIMLRTLCVNIFLFRFMIPTVILIIIIIIWLKYLCGILCRGWCLPFLPFGYMCHILFRWDSLVVVVVVIGRCGCCGSSDSLIIRNNSTIIGSDKWMCLINRTFGGHILYRFERIQLH